MSSFSVVPKIASRHEGALETATGIVYIYQQSTAEQRNPVVPPPTDKQLGDTGSRPHSRGRLRGYF